MGKRGPQPQPTALKLLHGYRADRVNDAEPLPSAEPVQCPDWLEPDAQEVWQRLAPDLLAQGVLTHWDVDCLAVFAQAVVHYRRAVTIVNQSGQLLQQTRGDRPSVMRNPAAQLARDQAAIIRAFAQEFGLTPAARSQLVSPVRQQASSSERLLS